jgi:hypothetical protein
MVIPQAASFMPDMGLFIFFTRGIRTFPAFHGVNNFFEDF